MNNDMESIAAAICCHSKLLGLLASQNVNCPAELRTVRLACAARHATEVNALACGATLKPVGAEASGCLTS